MNKHQSIPYLITKSLVPENQESPIHFLNKRITPSHYFYRRNHFTYPSLSPYNFGIQVSGHVNQARFFHYYEIISMPSVSITLPLECAGNKRANFTPKVFGEQWEDGAISQGKWTGVPLRYLLDSVGVLKETEEIVFQGADSGKKENIQGIVSFERSLPIEKALHPDTIIAYKYNDKPINHKQGFPLRLIVPNWYAMASVKWLTQIKAITHSFQGPFQTDDYVYYPYEKNNNEASPVTIQNVNSIIQYPQNLSILNSGTHKVKGLAWTGLGEITKVEISFDNGNSWKSTPLYPLSKQKYSWTEWFYTWTEEKKGEYSIHVRATDSSGRTQPLETLWNRKGYGYNEITKIKVKIE